MTTIKSSTTTTTAYSVEADTTGALVIQTGVTPTTALTVGSDQSVTFAGAVSLSGNQTITGNLTVNGNTTLGDASTDTILMTGAPSIGGAGLGMGMGFRNRIINGAMVIDQRNAGASVTVNSGNPTPYTLDRWNARQEASSGAFSVQRSTDAPTGFVNSLIATVTTADASITSNEGYSIYQPVEGFNSADLGWGTANAQSVTVSFWARSSVTGSFSLMLINSAFARNYGALYTINSANTWEYKTVVIPGDTSGTWLTDNGAGIRVGFGLGAGTDRTASVGWSTPAVSNTKAKVTGGVDWIATSGATFYITGVQLEKGSTATSFDYRPYGTELMLCQRYYQRMTNTTGVFTKFGSGVVVTATLCNAITVNTKVQMRVAPSIAGNVTVYDGSTSPTVTSFLNLSSSEQISFDATCSSGGLTANRPGLVGANAGTSYLEASAEL